jgi:uncharacterized protein YaaQ
MNFREPVFIWKGSRQNTPQLIYINVGSNTKNRNRMKTSKNIVNEFLKQLTNNFASSKTLILNFTKPKIIELNNSGTTVIINENDFDNIKNKQFELIVGDLPFGLQTVEINTSSKLKVSKNWSYVLSSLRRLEIDGKAFFLIEPSILFSNKGKRFLQDLSLENYYINSVFELPEKLLYPETAFQPIIIGFEKVENKNLFIGEITENFNILLKNYSSQKTSENLSNGIITGKNKFNSFSQFKIETEINTLKTQYKDYSRYSLLDIATIKLTRTEFENQPNSIYIPKIGNSQVVSDIKETTLKHQNYFQVVLNENIVKAEFLALFYRSELGKLILKSLTSGSFIPNINKSEIESSYVAIPKLEEQNLIIITNQKLSELQETINQLKTELSLNPKNANVILEKFESIQSPLKQLSQEDLIYSLIRKGENKHIEFKETFSKSTDPKKPKYGQKDTEVEKASLKTIVGFLNAGGGTLLIGIADDGTVKGVEEDFYKSNDKYKLNFKNALNTKIGSEFYSLIDFELLTVGGKQILKVDCKQSFDPCFFDQKEFFVRTNPATDKLEGKKQADYIRNHFK